MNTQSCQFVTVSSLFQDADLAWRTFNNFLTYERGDGSKSMFQKEVFSHVLTYILDKLPMTEDSSLKKQCNVVIDRLEKLNEEVFVDMAN